MIAITALVVGLMGVHVPAGSYLPLYGAPSKAGATKVRVQVPSFEIDEHAVTNAEYLAFVRAHPEWRRSRVKALVADEGYLRHWAGDLELGPNAPPASPVVNVSWFAARAYLRSVGKDLPTVDQWEYVAAASATRRDASRDPAFLERLREWYSRPTPPVLPAAAGGPRNAYGVSGLHGLVWEWTLDFNSSLVTGESRADSDLDRSLYCGSGAAAATSVEDYAAFMRYAFRSSLQANYAVANLGFRGVKARAGAREGLSAAASIYDLDLPLLESDGRARSLADLRGRTTVAAMIYTSCTTVCPSITETLKAIERRLPERDRGHVTFALFSLDPGRDTPAALRTFAAEHHLDGTRWRLFAASENGVRTLAAVLGVKYAAEPSGAIAHSATIVVIDRDGAVRFRQAGLASDLDSLVRGITAAR
jgi:formylglycine-generating enzyme required for sulfatase activity